MFQGLESILLGFWAGFLSWAYKPTVIMGGSKDSDFSTRVYLLDSSGQWLT